MTTLRFKPHFNATEFLENNWQKTPILLPNILDFPDPLTPEELAGLACEEVIESRMVLGRENWTLSHGPFKESDFTGLESKVWTLLVQGTDYFLNELKDLRNLFRFLPQWRLEDIMISYATAGGGVGPHFDYYDVFLVQGSGQRRWKVGKKSNNSSVCSNSSLMLLTDFVAEKEFVLNAGDVLYIPPQYSHWGIAETNSFCYSVGFRAPSTAEILEGFSDYLMETSDPASRFKDSLQTRLKSPYFISTKDVNNAHSLMQNELSDMNSFAKWFGIFMTQPKYPEYFSPPNHNNPPVRDLITDIKEYRIRLSLNPASRTAFTQAPDENGLYFFIDGKVHHLVETAAEIIIELCESSSLVNSFHTKDCFSNEMEKLLLDMIAEGSLLMTSAIIES